MRASMPSHSEGGGSGVSSRPAASTMARISSYARAQPWQVRRCPRTAPARGSSSSPSSRRETSASMSRHASLIAPAFTAGAISLEREKQTLDMLVSTPMRPGGIVVGKLLSALAFVVLMIVAAIPISALVLMYGGAINLGAALNASGAAGWLAASTIGGIPHSGPVIVLVLSATTILLSEAMNSSAVIALLTPVTIGLAEHAGVDPLVMVPAIAIPAGLGFMLPIATPANAMAYSSGYLSVRDLLVPSIVMIVGSLIVFNLVANWYWPLIGLSLQP